MQKLTQHAKELFGIQLTEKQLNALAIYERELIIWNKRISLTAIRDVEGIRTKHFLDSFSCVQAWGDEPPQTLVDVGVGAGFPGIPLKIIYPEMQLTLIESVAKKANFCKLMVETLNLDNVTVIQAR